MFYLFCIYSMNQIVKSIYFQLYNDKHLDMNRDIFVKEIHEYAMPGQIALC